MHFTSSAIALAAGFFAAMLILIEVGQRHGARRLAQDTEGSGPKRALPPPVTTDSFARALLGVCCP